jgi:hypothetical protein
VWVGLTAMPTVRHSTIAATPTPARAVAYRIGMPEHSHSEVGM